MVATAKTFCIAEPTDGRWGTPETPWVRESLLNQVVHWLQDPTGKQIMCLVGYPGSGKSEVARQVAEVVEQSDDASQLAAWSLRAGSSGGSTNAREIINDLLDYAVNKAEPEATKEILGPFVGQTMSPSVSLRVGDSTSAPTPQSRQAHRPAPVVQGAPAPAPAPAPA